MFCHGCGAELPRDEEMPEVEAPVMEEPVMEAPKKKVNPIAIIVAIVAALAVVAVGVVMIFNANKETGTPVEDPALAETSEVEVAVAHHVNAFGNQSFSIHYTEGEDGTYTYDYMNEAGELISVTQEEVDEMLDQVVASCDEYQITNRELLFYFDEGYYSFAQTYGYFLSLLINTAQGLDEQIGSDGVNTWQYMFLQEGVNLFHTSAAVAAEAKATGFDLTGIEADVEDYREQLRQTVEGMGYETIDDFLAEYLMPGATEEACLAYYKMRLIYQDYMEMLSEKQTITEEDINAYYTENEQTLVEQGITMEDKNVVNIRHILIAPEQTTAEDGTTSISDEAWAAAEAQAQELYDQWLSGDATEESFAELATANTADSGSQSTGGLYEDVYPGQMVTEFNDWCFADGRAVGDHGVVKTSYGYHIMFFSGEGDYIYWRKVVEDAIINERLGEEIINILLAHPMESDLSNAILLDSIAPTIPSEENPGGVVIEEVDPSEVPVEHTHTEE